MTEDTNNTATSVADTAVAQQSTAVTAIYGLSGAGKTSLAATAAEYVWEVHKKITRFYASDLGGWGNKLISLIKLGIVQIWYLRNHVDAFATVERASQGWWPETIANVAQGLADPQVRLVPPHRTTYTLVCQNGHDAAKYSDAIAVQQAQVLCPNCQVLVNLTTCLRVDKQVVQSRGFTKIGANVYDSMTALNDWGMADMAVRGARGELGGENAALDKVVSDGLVFGMNNRAHYGFVQNRTAGWIANALAIPGQAIPPVMTFLEEVGTDEGGSPVYGPKIAGSAKTGDVPAWVGNCLHATKELNEQNLTEHRLYLATHIDPHDPRAVPHLAKHRGEPLGMPIYLADAPGEAPWTRFSLKMLFVLIDEQLKQIEARDRAKWPDAPALVAGEAGGAGAEEPETVISHEQQAGVALGAVAPPPVTGGRTRRRGRGLGPSPSVTGPTPSGSGAGDVASPPAPSTPVLPPAVTAGVGVPATEPVPEPPPTVSPVVAQLDASLRAQQAQQAEQVTQPTFNGAAQARPAGTIRRRVPRPPA